MASINNFTEAELVAALKMQENSAFEYLYNNYKGAMFTIVKQIISDEDIAEDTLQEAFVTIWKNITKYDSSKGRLFTWMYNVTRNCAINTIRSKAFKTEQKNESIGNYVNNDVELATNEINIDKIGLRKIIGHLREDYRNVLELSYFNGFKHDEIAQVLNIPQGTVKTRLRNALIELRKHFV